jgi:hypothetical protein
MARSKEKSVWETCTSTDIRRRACQRRDGDGPKRGVPVCRHGTRRDGPGARVYLRLVRAYLNLVRAYMSLY